MVIKMKKQKIFCDVYNCIHCDSTYETCKLSSIRVSTPIFNDENTNTICENFKEIK